MKKLMTTLCISVVLLLTGCASNPWDEIPDQEINEWKGIGVSPTHANQFRQNGFTPLDVKPWIQSGIHSPVTIMNWHQAGFAPEEAGKWQSKGFTLQKAIELKKKGLTVE